ncbi:hypothetical protein GCM10011490_15320 [Pseudoclavibacter endophyticus]|uniref:Fluoride-specific ion channel n=1 Tax=Pseudoclavibacter endophyticus TaxID=1778590 RepID=A0A6H9WDQ4_9MICO|nr:CrcB family protein [Pseudoclavibacter endophyticus]KAB1649082.1 hypothetical protein F8O04_02020 [Pseudoclavibacter endophyticus]GGA65605.1 hypothetical protein GCM10011490_15320 [Pseudoclavibacter endophyticus]
MTPLVVTLTIAAGAGGALLRYVLQSAGHRRRDDGRTRGLTPEWRIVVINIVASFLAGAAFAVLPAAWEPVAIAGFCGGLSTWSTFMLDAHGAWRARRRLRAVALLAATIGYGLLAAIAGVYVGAILIGGILVDGMPLGA